MTSQETDKTNYDDMYRESSRIHRNLGWLPRKISEVLDARYGKGHCYLLSDEEFEDYLTWLKSLPL